MKTCIQNGTVVFEDRLERADLLVEDERIGATGPVGSLPQADLCIDAANCYVFPGFIDLHTHLDDVIGSRDLADTWKSGSQLALLNGVTTLFSFITQRPAETLSAAIERAMARAAGKSFCEYSWHLTPLQFNKQGWREIEAAIEQGFSTFKFYTTYREAGLFSAYDELEERIGRLHRLGCRVLVHCEDDEILQRVRQGGPDWSRPITHALVRPPEAELEAIGRLIGIARRTGAHIHIVHVSIPEGVDTIRAARDTQITCETCPQYLFLEKDWLARPDGHRWICAPPLRSKESQRELAAMARAGKVDLFATDHCAFAKKDKDNWDSDIRQVPGGVAGIGALPHLVFMLYQGEESGAAMVQIGQQLATAPAQIAGCYPRKGAIRIGADADLTVINFSGPERPIVSSLADTWETYPGMTTILEIKYVFLRGRLAAADGRIAQPKNPAGAFLCV